MSTPSTARAPRWFTGFILATLIGCGTILVLGAVDALADFAVQAAL